MKKILHHIFIEYSVLGVFVAVGVIGILYGALFTLAPRRLVQQSTVESGSVRGVATYRQDVQMATTPFFVQVVARIKTASAVRSAPSESRILVQKTRESLLAMKVPNEERDAHLRIVLLLDKWDRALGGSEADIKNLFSLTNETLSGITWLVP